MPGLILPERGASVNKRSNTGPRRELRNLGMMAGLGIILYFCVQMLISFVITVTPLREIYESNMSVRYAFSCVASILSVGGVFYVIRLLEGRLLGIRCSFPMRPNGALSFILAIPSGFALCLCANYVATLVGMMTESVGVELSQPEQLLPTDPAGIAVYLISVALIPPIVEEFAIRGVVMQPLLKYGRGFAVTASALVFGILHGNPKQMVFAFVSGLVIGYFVSSTGSLLTGIAIHLVNNAFSVANSYLIQAGQDGVASVLLVAAIGIGLVCLILYLIFGIPSGGQERKITGGRWRFFINAVFLLAAALMALNAAQYINPVG